VVHQRFFDPITEPETVGDTARRRAILVGDHGADPMAPRMLRSMGTAGESATAIATLLKRKAAGVHQRARILEIRLARSPPGPKPVWEITTCTAPEH